MASSEMVSVARVVPVKTLIFIIDVCGVFLNFAGVALSFLTHNWFFLVWCAAWSFYFLDKTLKTIDKFVEDKNEIHD